jgi:hypothetical protein
MALQPFVGPWPLSQFLAVTYTVGRTPWTGDQHVAGPLPAHRATQTQNKRTQYIHPCLERDSNPRSQRSSGVKTTHTLDRAVIVIGICSFNLTESSFSLRKSRTHLFDLCESKSQREYNENKLLHILYRALLI